MKAAVKAIKFFETFADTGLRGKITQKFFSGLLTLTKPRAKVIDDNLKIAYPDSSEQWRKNLRSQVYTNLAWTITEILALQHDPAQAFDWIKTVNNEEILNYHLNNRKGAIFLTGHFGNWELFASWYAQKAKANGHELHIIVQEMHDPDISEYISKIRQNSKILLLPKELSVMKLAHMLKNGAHIALLNDIAGIGKVMVPFMGRDATNMPGPAVMSILSGASIIPCCIYRNAPFEHEIEFFAPVRIPDKSFDNDTRMRKIILDYNATLEKFIRKRPELWFWLHKRWRA